MKNLNQNENQEKLEKKFSFEPLVKKPRDRPSKNLLTNLKNIKYKKIMLRCIVIGAYAVQFLLYVHLYRNTQHYATLKCSIKTRLCAGDT